VTGGNAWDTTSAVAAVLPGGLRHAEFMQSLDRVAEFISSLRGPGRTGKDAAIPVIFRPFHEMSGGWFWWGAGHAAPAEYRELWMFTVHYLRDVKGVHNVLYAYAPNAFNSGPMTQYWTQYPGDDYVDVLGWDEYFHAPRAGDTTNAAASLTSHLHWLVEQAESRGKVPALTETGYQAIPDPTWWTGTLLAALDADPVARRIAYLLVWRNAHRDAEHQDHFFAPYRGHASAADFVRFHDAPLTWFENDLPDVYREARR
jgi:mannan endo-1,4-beta-mannosidase